MENIPISFVKVEAPKVEVPVTPNQTQANAPVQMPKKAAINTGRPTVVTPKTIFDLQTILQRGLSIALACRHAGISEKTFYRHYNEEESFRLAIHKSRDYHILAASSVVMDDIVKKQNPISARWWLERRAPEEFGNRPTVEINNNTQNNTTNFMLSDEQLKNLIANTGLAQVNPVELLKALEVTRTEEAKNILTTQ
jgi:AraC-like DNA-binding protein